MIRLTDVSFTYAGGRENAGVNHLNLEIASGEVVLLCGESGCGKTTVTRMVNGLIPHFYEGELSGTISVAGKNVAETELYDMAQTVGSVFQNPRSQFFNVDTTSELAFGCENLGISENEIFARVRKAVSDLSIHHLLDRSIFELSDGEKQKIACGSVSVLQPSVFVLDEPTSNLDFQTIKALRRILSIWKAEGKTILVAEHRLHFLRGIADRVIFMRDGEIRETYDGDKFFSMPPRFFEERGLRIPSLDRLNAEAAEPLPGNGTIRIENLRVRFPGSDTILSVPVAEVPDGAVIAVIGSNGAGKTTFARSLCGLISQDRGLLTYRGKTLTAKKRLSSCYLVMQDVNHQLFTESVLDEALLSMNPEDEGLAGAALASLDLSAFREDHPMSLSGGQKQRVAIASALVSGRDILVFDEPTSGLDLIHMRETAGNIAALRRKGVTSFVVTHDPEFILSCCTHAIRIEHGEIVENYALSGAGVQRPIDFFSANPWGGVGSSGKV